ncbi:hypothetical protein Q5H92_21905 [Hymenobacter sp. M29]|uniref:DUF1772 domain-containing protein n=1 Tax=Hymenobacter mellowenesis TaxID=3063995 RepID=A0ABT9AIU3_9BACT|nr:hypothetical protein [Hymenobacter sp. M29]MDO7849035.1 hypothetical protein [Hymenobacter sp. M29]
MPNFSPFSRFLCALLSTARKLTPWLLFFAAGAGMLYGPAVIREALARFYHSTAAAGVNMSGAEVTTETQAAGWLPFGVVTSKMLATVGMFVVLCLIVWRMQRLVLPGPAKWAKNDYPKAFEQLPTLEKFRVYQVGRWQLIALVGIAAVFAALAQ